MWDAFMRFPDFFDPDQIFVTDYWRAHLGIQPKGQPWGPPVDTPPCAEPV